MNDPEIARLEAQIARGKASDRTARVTDAMMHLRKAIELLDGAIEPSQQTTRLVGLLVEAADLLTGQEGDGLSQR